MSENAAPTPETDALNARDHDAVVGYYAMTEHARKLERLLRAPQQQAEPVAEITDVQGSLNDICIVTWRKHQPIPPAGTLLYTGPPPDDEAVQLLREDAERYRWIRDKSQFGPYKSPTMLAYCPETPDPPLLVGNELDAAIDAARKEPKG